jgi:SOS-response transcriptional repressor LexA
VIAPLTDRQRAVYDFIADYWRERGRSPTGREISQRFGFRSPNGAVNHLRALQRRGLIARDPDVSRGIRLVARDGGGVGVEPAAPGLLRVRLPGQRSLLLTEADAVDLYGRLRAALRIGTGVGPATHFLVHSTATTDPNGGCACESPTTAHSTGQPGAESGNAVSRSVSATTQDGEAP